MVTIQDIEQAQVVLRGVAHKTPLLSSGTLNRLTGNKIFFKAENFQRIGAFKFRGAYNKLYSLSETDRRRGVIAHSSGNHAQGVALAAKLFGVKATVVMPHNSVPNKIEATRSYGAEVVFCGDSTDEREKTADSLISRYGYTLIHPYNDEQLIAGQGTVGLEIFDELPDPDYLFVPIGGGGLISGCALAARHRYPAVKIIGVETEPANDCYQSFRQKKIVKITEAPTIADGMRTLSVGTLNFALIMNYVDDVIAISDEDLLPTMKFFLERMKIVVEPTGAVAPAAVMKNILNLSEKKICAVISGGNISPSLLKTLWS